MFLPFFLLLRQNALPVTLPEYLMLLDALRTDAGGVTVDDFYYLSKTALVKHEQHLDLFDRLFGEWVSSESGLGTLPAATKSFAATPPDWLRDAMALNLSEEEKDNLETAGGLDALYERFRELLNEQNGPHEGGDKWIGTGSTAPFGVEGYAPEGFRLNKSVAGEGNRRAANVWEDRAYKNLDDGVELNTRNMKMAMRRLRILTREGAPDELDLDETIAETSRNGGYLDIKLHPSRQNRVKVLILFDVGGSMDEHVDLCNQLFSAARYQFKHLEFLYFHNCVYETLWKDNRGNGPTGRRERLPTYEVLHKYNKEYKVIFVGDAAMSPYEITQARGSVEHYNEEAGIVWLDRFRKQYPHLVWLNPTPAGYWQYTHSTNLIRDWSGNRMFPLTLGGLGQAMKSLKNPKVTFEG